MIGDMDQNKGVEQLTLNEPKFSPPPLYTSIVTKQTTPNTTPGMSSLMSFGRWLSLAHCMIRCKAFASRNCMTYNEL